jgi:hypothetical protein
MYESPKTIKTKGIILEIGTETVNGIKCTKAELCSGKEAWKTQKENGFPKENQTPTTVSSVR